ncbi:MAG: hypothetical protein KAG96_01630 [Ichthyobacteriaceae bacterium]|nr:hypothetical protein [Ichthyobacteriaceae bacterium]
MNISKQILVEHSVKNAILIANYIELNPDLLPELINITLYGDKISAQRSAWSLAKFSDEFYVNLLPFIDEIINNLNNVKHAAVSRNYARLLMVISERKNKYKIPNNLIDKIVETAFTWLINIDEKAAVKGYSMYTLYNLSDRRKWILPELKTFIDNNYAGSPPYFQAVGRMILKKKS